MQRIGGYIVGASFLVIGWSALVYAAPPRPSPEHDQAAALSSLASLAEGVNDVKVGIVCARGRQERVASNGAYLARYLGYAVVRFAGDTDETVLIVSPEEPYPRTGSPRNYWHRGRAARNAVIHLHRQSLDRARKHGKPAPPAQQITVWKHGPDLYLVHVDDDVVFHDITDLELDVLYEELDVTSVAWKGPRP